MLQVLDIVLMLALMVVWLRIGWEVRKSWEEDKRR